MKTKHDVRIRLLWFLLAATLLGQGWAACREERPQRLEQEVPEATMTIQEAKEAWEAKLMAIPGVSGVGIGLTKDGQQKCIKVYVARDRGDVSDEIPKTIEGYPVEVEARGPFRAQ
jgi:hypothetical protein